MSDELLDIAQGDVRLARTLREILESLAEHRSDHIREMARAVLDGASLREMAASGVYGQEVGTAFGAFWENYQSLTLDERAELEATAREHLEGPAGRAAGPHGR